MGGDRRDLTELHWQLAHCFCVVAAALGTAHRLLHVHDAKHLHVYRALMSLNALGLIHRARRFDTLGMCGTLIVLVSCVYHHSLPGGDDHAQLRHATTQIGILLNLESLRRRLRQFEDVPACGQLVATVGEVATEITAVAFFVTIALALAPFADDSTELAFMALGLLSILDGACLLLVLVATFNMLVEPCTNEERLMADTRRDPKPCKNLGHGRQDKGVPTDDTNERVEGMQHQHRNAGLDDEAALQVAIEASKASENAPLKLSTRSLSHYMQPQPEPEAEDIAPPPPASSKPRLRRPAKGTAQPNQATDQFDEFATARSYECSGPENSVEFQRDLVAAQAMSLERWTKVKKMGLGDDAPAAE